MEGSPIFLEVVADPEVQTQSSDEEYIGCTENSEFNIPLSVSVSPNPQREYDMNCDLSENESNNSDTFCSSDELSDHEEFTRVQLNRSDWLNTLNKNKDQLSYTIDVRPPSPNSISSITSMEEIPISRSRKMTFHKNKLRKSTSNVLFNGHQAEENKSFCHTNYCHLISPTESTRNVDRKSDGIMGLYNGYSVQNNRPSNKQQRLVRQGHEKQTVKKNVVEEDYDSEDINDQSDRSTILVNENEAYFKTNKQIKHKVDTTNKYKRYALKIIKDEQYPRDIDKSKKISATTKLRNDQKMSRSKASFNRTSSSSDSEFSCNEKYRKAVSVMTQTDLDVSLSQNVEKCVQTIITCALPDLLLEAAYPSKQCSCNKEDRLQALKQENQYLPQRRACASFKNNVPPCTSGFSRSKSGNATNVIKIHRTFRKWDSFTDLSEQKMSNERRSDTINDHIYTKTRYNRTYSVRSMRSSYD